MSTDGAGGPPPERVGIGLPPERGGSGDDAGSGQQPPPFPQQQPLGDVPINTKNYHLKASEVLCMLILDESIDHTSAVWMKDQVLAYKPSGGDETVRQQLQSSTERDLVKSFGKWWYKSKGDQRFVAWAQQAMEIHR